jgi:hypothetical protein
VPSSDFTILDLTTKLLVETNTVPCFCQWPEKYNLTYSIQIPRTLSTEAMTVTMILVISI